MPKRITIHDVAREADCSIATVSLVLNGSGRIGEVTREKVNEVIKRMGYQPNTAGRNLRLQRTDTIGLMFNPSPSKIFKNIFYIEMMEGLEETFYQNSLSLLLGSGREELAVGNLPKFMRTGAVDALILMGQFPDNDLEVLLDTRTPVFLLDSFHPHLAVECLTSDGYSGAGKALDHLVDLGHSRIAMLAYDGPEYNIASRISGFQASVRRHGLDPLGCPVINQFKFNDELPAIFDRLLVGPERPTALICINDTLAVYVTDHLMTERGISVPSQISVIGFDDDSIARQHRPSISTVRIDSHLLGQKGAEMVMERLKDPAMPLRKIILPVEFVARESTGPASR
jgi:DNA-binding LacI/PurR family transcriptional regulator